MVTAVDGQAYDAAGNNLAGDSGMFGPGAGDGENSRQFYLGYSELLEDFKHSLMGEIKNSSTDQWERVKDAGYVSETAAIIITNMLNTSLHKVMRLGNLQGLVVQRFAYEFAEVISGWLANEGWLRFQIKVEHFDMIKSQCTNLAFAAYSWGMNAGGQRFMTTSGRWVQLESINSLGMQQGGSGKMTGQVETAKKWFNPPKFGK